MSQLIADEDRLRKLATRLGVRLEVSHDGTRWQVDGFDREQTVSVSHEDLVEALRDCLESWDVCRVCETVGGGNPCCSWDVCCVCGKQSPQGTRTPGDGPPGGFVCVDCA